MLRFENPLDVSKDDQNFIMDGIRYRIRESLMIKEKVEDFFKYVEVNGSFTAEEILNKILYVLKYKENDLIASEKKDLLKKIKKLFIER